MIGASCLNVYIVVAIFTDSGIRLELEKLKM